MTVEDELFAGLVEVFQHSNQMVRQFQSLSRGRMERMLRETMRDWPNNDPEANAKWQQINHRAFEQRVAAKVKEILDERFGPENAAEQDRDPQTQQVEAPETEQGEEAEAPGAEVPEVGQQGSVLEQTVDGEVVVQPVIGAEELQAGSAGQEPEFFGQADAGQLVSPVVIGEDAPVPTAEQDDNPINTGLRAEQLAREAVEQQALAQAETPIDTQFVNERAREGQERPEGEQVDSPARDHQAAAGGAANNLDGQGEAAAAQSPELTPDERTLQRLQNGGRPSPAAAAQRPEGAPAASPHAGAHHQTPSKGGPGRGD